MIKIRLYPSLIIILSLSFLFVLSSCDFGPKPDKSIEMTIELDKYVNSDQEFDSIMKVLNNRLKKITADFLVSKISDEKQIKVEAKTHQEVERFKRYILSTGTLGFYETYTLDEMTPFITEVNELLKDTMAVEEKDPLFDLLVKDGVNQLGGPVLFYVQEKDTALVRTYISSQTVKPVLKINKRIKFLWGIKENEKNGYPLYAVKKTASGKPILSGAVIESASQSYDFSNNPVVSLQMNEVGARIWERMTGKASEERSHIAIVVNNEVYSAPGVSSGPIKGGRSEISGNFTVEEAQDFANILVSGVIPKMSLVRFEVKKIE